MFSVLGGISEISLLILGLRLAALGVQLGVFLGLCGRTLYPFFDFPEKGSKKVQTRREKGALT